MVMNGILNKFSAALLVSTSVKTAQDVEFRITCDHLECHKIHNQLLNGQSAVDRCRVISEGVGEALKGAESTKGALQARRAWGTADFYWEVTGSVLSSVLRRSRNRNNEMALKGYILCSATWRDCACGTVASVA